MIGYTWRSMSFIFLSHFILSEVHQHLCSNSGVACITFIELQLGDHRTSSPTNSLKIIYCNLLTLLEDKQFEEGGFMTSHFDH